MPCRRFVMRDRNQKMRTNRSRRFAETSEPWRRVDTRMKDGRQRRGSETKERIPMRRAGGVARRYFEPFREPIYRVAASGRSA
jgi:hypothetical protein